MKSYTRIFFLVSLLSLSIMIAGCSKQTSADDSLSESVVTSNQYSSSDVSVLTESKEESKKESKEESVSHTKHIYDKGIITKTATCSEDGIKTYTCTVCSQTKTEVIAKTGKHTYDSGIVVIEPTCAEEGTKKYTCKVCGKTKTKSVSKTDEHLYDDGVVTKEATCGTDGVKTFTCSVCGKTKNTDIAQTGKHAYDKGVVAKKASCSTEGEMVYACTVCGKTKTKSIPKNDKHNYDSGTTDRDTGNVTYTCTNCGASYADTTKGDQALKVAQEIADYVESNSPKDATDLEKVQAAAEIVAGYSSRAKYTTDDSDYRTPYGVFVKGVYTCAGSTSALGLVLTCMGYNWEHVNKGEWTHQWCRLTMDGKTGYADGQVGWAGYGSHPVEQ
ncbi:MAG: hypothetical protein ACI4XP_00970 [Acutalibacteraceae bacterium]